MSIPTGHQTITHADNKRSMGRLFRGARDGDTYVDTWGRHWLCQGKMTAQQAANTAHNNAVNTRSLYGVKINDENALPSGWALGQTLWGGTLNEELSQRSAVPISYETSYTRKVVERLSTLRVGFTDISIVSDAMALLKQYHHDLAVPYQQRDEARQNLVVKEAQLKMARDELRSLKIRFKIRLRYLAGRANKWLKDIE